MQARKRNKYSTLLIKLIFFFKEINNELLEQTRKYKKN